MRQLSVGIILVGAALSQTKQSTSAIAPSKQNIIQIGMDLQLGMSREAIITQLAGNHKVEKLEGEGDDWFVAEKGSPTTWLGVLGFHGGKLTYASRRWTEGQEDSYSFAEALWGAMAQMSDEDQHACLFDVPTSRSPTAEMKNVRFYCGQKKIEITTTNVLNGTGKGRYAQIEEVLSSEKNR